MRRPSFTVLSIVLFPGGKHSDWWMLYDRTPAQQLQLLNQSLVGYDPHHPDGPNKDTDLVWKTPEKYRITKSSESDKPA